MAENIVISIAAKIAEYTVAPVGQWLCYSCHYNSNIENLKKQKEKLQDARERVQDSVDAALRNGEKIYADVSKWLTDVDRITELATTKLREIEEEAGTGSFNASCLNLKHRHQLSREAKKIVEDIVELHNNGNFKEVSKPALPLEEMDYNSNMENLKNQKEKLQHARERVQDSVDAALRNGEKIYPYVSKWLTDMDGITELATTKLREIEEEAGTGSSNAACLNSEHRHQLSREAKKIVENIAELHENGKFEKVSYRTPPSEGMVITTTYMAMESRMTALKGIMEALGNADIDKIGVWGMPGVGKSTLMKEIARKAREEKLFNEVVMTVVTNSPDVRRIQGEIADTLGLKFDQETEPGRASHLQRRLSKDKKILVILDDIWKAFDLHEIGIPSEGCKIVMTSRDRDVLISGMGTRKAIHELKTLQKEESWNLFEKMVGDSFKDRPEVRAIATKIAEKCAGLPIALVTVSKALRNRSLGIWKDALVQLTRPAPEHDKKIWLPVYSCIQLSYEHLDGEEAVKSLFLLCTGQGYYISYRDLLRYGFGLGLFLNIYTLEEARNRLESLVSNLLDSCLLLQSPRSSEEFYMHDLVRDVATIIASKNHNMFVMRDDGGQKAWPDVGALNRCEALSIHVGDIHKHPNKMECPKLRFFHVDCKDSRNLKIPNIFFQGMDKLEVLSLRYMQLSSLFPLTNLQTLCLDGCRFGDIHWIGELKTLVILSLAYSDISNLPREIESLTRLRLLDLTHCYKLKVIPPNVLSSLVNLEELYMREIKVQWEVEGPSNEGKNASLAELKKLSHLTTLEIDIPDANNLPKDLFTEKFERYHICIGDIRWENRLFKEEAFSRTLRLKLNTSFQLDFGIKMLLKRTEYLYLNESNSTKSVLYELNREDFQKLKHLHIRNNGDIKHILELRTPAVAFPILETFVLEDMISLEEICQGKLPFSTFKYLKVLKVYNCDKLRFIFSSSIARGLSLLEELNITSCYNMGAIFVKEEEDGIEDQGDMMSFGRLQTLVLKGLPKLVGFLSTKDSFMADCRETNSEGNHDLQLPLLHHDQVSFPSLQRLRMEGLPKIKHVWSCGQEPKTVFTGLEQLKILEISNCGVEEIVAVEGGGEAVAIRTLVFPRVSTLKFTNLKRLKWFYKGVHVSKWPMLKEMKIEKCEEFEIFASGVASFEETVGERQYEMSIKQPLFLVDEHSFPSLKTLLISHCEGLFHVFPTAILMRSLTYLRITDCCSLELIFGKLEGQNGKEPQVLISPASGTEESGATTHFASTISFPSLQTLCMKDLPKIKHVWSYDQEPQTMFRFQALQYIYVGKCESLTSLFPAWVLRCLEQLKKIVIEDCGVEEIVAVERGGEAVAIRTLVFPRVSTLELRNLKRLKWFCKGVHVSKWPMLKWMKIQRCEKVKIFASGFVNFQETVKDQRQSEMSNIKQLLFSVDEHSFPSLQILFISNMDSVEIIFGKLEGQNGKEPQVLISPASGTEESGATTHFASTLSFPSLKMLHIREMDKLEIIWQDQVTATSFPNIQKLTISNCAKLLHVFQSNLHTTTTLIQSLTILNISSCSSLETVFGNMEGQNGKEPQVLMAPSSGMEESVAREDGIARHIEFPILTQLSLSGLPKLKWIFEGVHTNLESWPSLKRLRLWECGEQVNKKIWASKFASSSSSQENQLPTCIQQPMFVVEEGTFPNLEYLSLYFGGRTKCPSRFSDFPDPSSLLTGLPNLLNLDVFDCVLEEIFPYELVDREIRLRILRLCRLCMLTHLWKEDNTQPCQLFHNLEYLDVSQCGKLKNLVPSSVSLHNLTRLKISSCHGLINLLTSSTAKTLVQLERMTVIDCKRITEIVAMEDIGEANVAITFNKLRCLELHGLPNLTHFCSGPYSVGFPSLDEVIVRCCPEMKTFSHGVLSTPMPTIVYDLKRWISKRNLHWKDDLNTTTRCLWEESNQYDTRLLFRERVENSEEDEDHP